MMETNVLKAIENIIKNPNNDLVNHDYSLNRMNGMGESLEIYIKDIFSNTLAENDMAIKEKAYSECFSYLGNQNNPPDIILKNGDAIEVKKHIGMRASGLALNSSYPKDYLYSDSPMITQACKECEDWSKKDIVYVIGSVVNNKIKSLWLVYGNCYAANRDVYEKIKKAISDGVNELPDIEFGSTNELARINKVDPLGITDLRIRGMWAIKHPSRVFDYLPQLNIDANFTVTAILLTSKYDSFPQKDRESIENLTCDSFQIKDIKIKSPNNPAKLLEAKLIRFMK